MKSYIVLLGILCTVSAAIPKLCSVFEASRHTIELPSQTYDMKLEDLITDQYFECDGTSASNGIILESCELEYASPYVPKENPECKVSSLFVTAKKKANEEKFIEVVLSINYGNTGFFIYYETIDTNGKLYLRYNSASTALINENFALEEVSTVMTLGLSFYDIGEQNELDVEIFLKAGITEIRYSARLYVANHKIYTPEVVKITKGGDYYGYYTFYHLVQLNGTIDNMNELRELIGNLDPENGRGVDLSGCHSNTKPFCKDNAYLTMTSGGINSYACSCIEGYEYHDPGDTSISPCMKIHGNDKCGGFCVKGCREEYDPEVHTVVECFEECKETYEQIEIKGEFVVCKAKEEEEKVEEENSDSGTSLLLTIGAPVAGVLAVGGTAFLLCTKCRAILKCCKRGEEESDTVVPSGVKDTPTDNAGQIGGVLVNEAKSTEAEAASTTVRNLLGSIDDKVDKAKEMKEKLEKLTETEVTNVASKIKIRVGRCIKCKKPGVILNAIFQCKHYNLCEACGETTYACPSCDNREVC